MWKRHGTNPVEVALKSLNKKGSEDKLKFLQEAAIMAQFRHPNVILLHGVVTRGKPVSLNYKPRNIVNKVVLVKKGKMTITFK